MIKNNDPRLKLKETVHEMLIAMCLDGQCYAFAIALHRCLGWPMVGLMQENVIRHACVSDLEGNLWDCRGMVNKEEFGRPFGITFPYDLNPVTEKDLNSKVPISEPLIESLSKMAQTVWPDLPWKSDTFLVRVRAFAEDLEALSRKHELWIYGNSPNMLPAIAEGVGDEKGYTLESVISGYVINRSL